jgi:hypothetical protein
MADEGVASHRERADDMARHAVEEVQSVLLTGVGGGHNLTVHPAQNYSVPRGEPEKARNGCHVWFTWSEISAHFLDRRLVSTLISRRALSS